ncbi:MAG TPA: hypothetical protein VM577_11025 [Anaerovoracaceae bacterium]|nr:hypothetical protein [Anaerovoracaceae bacterium]
MKEVMIAEMVDYYDMLTSSNSIAFYDIQPSMGYHPIKKLPFYLECSNIHS